MQRKTLAAAVTAVFAGGFASQALAIDPTTYNAGTALDVFLSGATATENQIQAYHRLVCKPGTSSADRMDIVRATNQFVFFCRTRTNAELTLAGVSITLPTALENRIIAVRKSGVGGSGNGVLPVSNQSTTVPFLNFSNVGPAIAACTSSIVAANGPQVSYVQWTCPTAFGVTTGTNTAISQTRSQGGCSDLEPKLFNVSSGLNPIVSTNQVIFGVPTTRVLYRALQSAQGITTGTSHGDWNCTQDTAWDLTNAIGTDVRAPRSDCERSMPSLNRATLRSLYSQSLGTWDQVSPPPTTNPDPVYIARRVDSSGTQRSAEVYHFNARCDLTIPFMPSANDGGTCGADTVNEGSGSGNVITCLNTHNSAGRFAIGILSTEFVASACQNVKSTLSGTSSGVGAITDTQPACGSTSTGTAGEQGALFRFVKVDSNAPTLINVANGRYEFYYESSCQSAAAPVSPPDTDSKLWADTTWPNLNIIGVIADINLAFRQSIGDTGLMGIPSFTSSPDALPYTVAGLRAKPLGSTTRAPGGTPNSCNLPTAIYPLPTAD
jgi:hypothetical protein